MSKESKVRKLSLDDPKTKVPTTSASDKASAYISVVASLHMLYSLDVCERDSIVWSLVKKLSLEYPVIFMHLAKGTSIDVSTADASSHFPWMVKIDACLLDGRKIDAIKIWRAETGEGLKEAKEGVEAYMEANPSKWHPKDNPF